MGAQPPYGTRVSQERGPARTGAPGPNPYPTAPGGGPFPGGGGPVGAVAPGGGFPRSAATTVGVRTGTLSRDVA